MKGLALYFAGLVDIEPFGVGYEVVRVLKLVAIGESHHPLPVKPQSYVIFIPGFAFIEVTFFIKRIRFIYLR